MAIPNPLHLEAEYAMSLHPVECEYFDRGVHYLNDRWGWTGWKVRCWPADVVRPGLFIYKYDLRDTERKLCVLLELTHGGSFNFGSMDEFAQKAQKLTYLRPDPTKDDDSFSKWQEIEERLNDNLSKGRLCTGLCLRWKVVKPVSIPLPGAFPQLGWCDLRELNYGIETESKRAKQKPPQPRRVRVKRQLRMKNVWGVFNNSN